MVGDLGEVSGLEFLEDGSPGFWGVDVLSVYEMSWAACWCVERCSS